MSHQLDTSGLLCPMPVIRVQNTLKNLAVGDQLEVTCTDPGTLNDIPTWCRINGHEVLKAQQEESKVLFLIEKR